MLDILYTFAGIFIDVCLLASFLSVFNRRVTIKIFICVYTVYGSVIFCMNMLSVPDEIRIIMNMLCIMIVAKLCYTEKSLFECIKDAILFILLLGASELFIIPATLLGTGVYDIELFLPETFSPLWLVTMFVTKGIALWLIQVSRKYSKINVYSMNRAEIAILYMPLVISLIAFIVIIYYLTNLENLDQEKIIFLLVLVSVMLMLFTILHMFFFENFLNVKKKNDEIEKLKYKNQMQYGYYKEKLIEDEKLKQIYHDLKNHIIVIQSGASNERKQYVENLLQRVVEYDDWIVSGCNVLDAILYAKKAETKLLKINMEVIIVKDLADINFVDEIDLCTIFGKLLDNAIEGCQRASETTAQKIIINIDIVNSFFVMVIENSFNSESVQRNNNIFKTSKQDKLLHGIGIQSVKSAIDKYDGSLILEPNDEKFIVKALIPIKTK